MKDTSKKIAYSEPADYFPEEIRKEFKLGEYAEKETLLQYKSYYVYDFECEAILVADGEEQSKAYRLYASMAQQNCPEYEDKWAFDIALDCVRNMTDAECEQIKKEGEIPFYHFGYGMHVRNKYVYPSKKHTYLEADMISSIVEDYIYAIILE